MLHSLITLCYFLYPLPRLILQPCFSSLPPQVIRYSWKPFPPEISSSIQSVFHLSPSNLSISPPSQSSLTVGMAAVIVGCGLEVDLFLPRPLTLHIYADGLDGSHPHPVVGLAVVATPLHPLDALDAQRLVVDGCFLELVRCTACRLRPPYLERRGGNVELTKMLSGESEAF